jgi:hypothetical protein
VWRPHMSLVGSQRGGALGLSTVAPTCETPTLVGRRPMGNLAGSATSVGVAPDLSQNIRGKLLEPRRLRRTSCSVLNSAHRGVCSSCNSSSFSSRPSYDLRPKGRGTRNHVGLDRGARDKGAAPATIRCASLAGRRATRGASLLSATGVVTGSGSGYARRAQGVVVAEPLGSLVVVQRHPDPDR